MRNGLGRLLTETVGRPAGLQFAQSVDCSHGMARPRGQRMSGPDARHPETELTCEDLTPMQTVASSDWAGGTLPGVMAGKRPPRRAKLVLPVIFLALCAQATTYYVAKTGDDGNPGTEAQPWLTVTKCKNIVVAGDTVWVKAGTYEEPYIRFNGNAGTAAAPIVLKAYDGWSSVLRINVKFEKKHYRMEGFKIVRDSLDALRHAFKFDTGGDSCAIRDCEVTTTGPNSTYGGLGIHAGGRTGLIIANNTVHGFQCSYDSGAYGMYLECSNSSVVYNTVYDNSGLAFHCYSSGGNFDNNEVAYNIVHSNGSTGILTDGRCNSIHHNIIYNNDYRGIYLYPGTSDSNNVYNNVIFNNGYYGLNITGTGNVIKNNICVDNYAAIAFGSAANRTSTTLDYNCYGASPGAVWLPGSATFAKYRETTGQDAHAVLSDPAWVDTAAGDFRLTSSSPCINAGDPTTPFGFDINGIAMPQGMAVDIGAYEYPAYDTIPRRRSIKSVSFAITPNPLSSGMAAVHYYPPAERTARLEVFSASGRLVRSSFIVRRSSFPLDLRAMPAGVYLVRMTADGSSSTQKLIVARRD